MVEGGGQVHHAADGDGVIDDYGLFGDRAATENRNLRLIDHRRREERAEAAEVGDRERPAADFIGPQLAPQLGLSTVLPASKRFQCL